jgi:hypothetical protein
LGSCKEKTTNEAEKKMHADIKWRWPVTAIACSIPDKLLKLLIALSALSQARYIIAAVSAISTLAATMTGNFMQGELEKIFKVKRMFGICVILHFTLEGDIAWLCRLHLPKPSLSNPNSHPANCYLDEESQTRNH